MEMDKGGNLIHEDYTSKFNYGGTTFIVDKGPYGYLICERNFIIKKSGENLEDLKVEIKKHWDKIKHKYQ